MRSLNHNSVAIWHTIVKPKVTEMEEMVLRAYRDGLDYTDLEVSDKLHIPINRISGRVGGLLNKGQLEVVSYRPSKFSGIASRACRVKPQTLGMF